MIKRVKRASCVSLVLAGLLISGAIVSCSVEPSSETKPAEKAGSAISEGYVELQSQDRLQQKTFLIFGDSLAAAYKMPTDQGWVSLLAAKLAESCPDVRVVNASISGETTAGGLARLPALLAESQPSVVLLELGANDGLQGKQISQITSNLQKLIDHVKEFGAQTVLAGIRIPPNYGARYTEPFYAQFETLAKTNNIAHIPFLLEPVATQGKYKQADGIHPNVDAQPLILRYVLPYLKPVLKESFSCTVS